MRRGFFGRQWCQNEMAEMGLKTNIAQVNTSLNKEKGTLRGLHYPENHLTRKQKSYVVFSGKNI